MLEYFENEMRPYLICPTSDGEPFHPNSLLIHQEGQLIFAWCLAEVTFKDLSSCDKMKYEDNSLHVYRMMMQYVASCST